MGLFDNMRQFTLTVSEKELKAAGITPQQAADDFRRTTARLPERTHVEIETVYNITYTYDASHTSV